MEPTRDFMAPRIFKMSLFCTLSLACLYGFAAPGRVTKVNRRLQPPQRQKAKSWYSEQSLFSLYADPGIAEALSWTPDQNSFCRGNYLLPPIITNYPSPPPAGQEPITISASGPIISLNNGVVYARDNVRATQRGRMAQADQAYVYYDANKQLQKIDLLGRARLQRAKSQLAGSELIWDIKQNKSTAYNAIYHFKVALNKNNNLFDNQIVRNAWGTAKYAEKLPTKITNLNHASYSTCRPKHPIWRVSASHIHLNHNTGIGSATNALFFLKDIPIAYFPYYRFPIDSKRHTGFLTPAGSYSNSNGGHILWPFYWNIAPNYDLTTTPEWYSKHGAKIDNNFRFLTMHGNGNLYLGLLPYDTDYASRLKYLRKTYPGNLALSDLNQYTSPTRWIAATQDNIIFNKYWYADINATRVSDSYYLQDYSDDPNQIQANSLPEQANLYFNDSNWQWHAEINSPQNLYPVNSVPGSIDYARLPVISGNGSYPAIWGNLGFNANLQAAYFDSINAFTTTPLSQGARWHTRPGFDYPIYFASTTIDPQLWGDFTAYNLDRPAIGATDHNVTRALPMIAISSNSYFDAPWSLGSLHFTQSFEPGLFYLYVPYTKQDDIPVFDTELMPFSINNLSSLNSFSGNDRIQNANQLSYGFFSHTFDTYTGNERANIGLGIINYFENRKVGVSPSSLEATESFSPLATELTIYLNQQLSSTSTAAWDLHNDALRNAATAINYNLNNKLVMFGKYNFIYNGEIDPKTDTVTNYQYLTFGAAIPFNDHWSGLGYWDYNLERKLTNSYYGGFSYNSCCWAVRMLYSSTITEDTKVKLKYRNKFYIQFLFKGLGGVGDNMNSLLTSTNPGYSDPFKTN